MSISRPETLEIVVIDAASLRSRYGMAASTTRTECIRSTSNSVFQLSSPGSMERALTLATTASRPPRVSAASTTQALSAAPWRTSRARPNARTPISSTALAVAMTSASVRAQKATSAPSTAKASTIARPMPFVPPVTSARLPCRRRSMPGSLPVSA